MPPQNTDGLTVDTLGDAPLSALDDASFAAEFGLTDPAEVPAEEGPSAEETLDELGVTPHDDDVPADDDAEDEADDDFGAKPAAEVEAADEDEADDEEAPAARKPVTEFMVEDADGDLVDVEGVEITFVANHETHTLPLDKVVRLAQMGKYNEDLQQEVKATRLSVAEMQQEMESLRQLADQRRDLARRLLEDDDYLLAQRERYAEMNSPEARATRAEQRLAAIAAERETANFKQEIEAFVDQALYPAFDALHKQFPTVSFDELWGRFNLATMNISRNGIIPPQHWNDAMQVVERDLGPFAAQLHDQRSALEGKARSAESTAVRKAQEEATRAKRMVAKAIRPSGQGSAAAPKRKAIVSADDAVDDIMGGDVLDIVRSMRG